MSSSSEKETSLFSSSLLFQEMFTDCAFIPFLLHFNLDNLQKPLNDLFSVKVLNERLSET